MVADKPRVLILTSGYGDGHNSAARGVQEALGDQCSCRLMDVISLAMPAGFKYSRKGYLWVTANAPSLWRRLYDWSDNVDMSTEPLAGIGKIQDYLDMTLDEWQPDVIVCTYMIYPYMLDQSFARTGKRIPYVTVVTDSLEINKSWLCSRTDVWSVTDAGTKQVMVDRGLDGSRIFVSGFPVSPRLPVLAAQNRLMWKEGDIFRVLFFPQGSSAGAEAMLSALLAAHPDVVVTCVMGRHVRRYYSRLCVLRAMFGSRLKLKGWTRKVPELMATHHLVVGKAGGATTHECIAMARPMLVNFVTPGQEEGNVDLLEHMEGGRFVETPADLRETLTALMRDGGEAWRAMQQSLERHGIKNGARTIADWCLAAKCDGLLV